MRSFLMAFLSIWNTLVCCSLSGQVLPSVFKGLKADKEGLELVIGSDVYKEIRQNTEYGYSRMVGNPRGTDKGISFDFGEGFQGRLYFGFIPYGDSKHPMPVYFRRSLDILSGKVEIDILNTMRGTYDMVHWEDRGLGTVGYRVVNAAGQFIYDGIIGFTGKGPFVIDETIIEGPFVNQLTPHGATLSYTTNMACRTIVQCGDQEYRDASNTVLHEIHLSGLEPDSLYSYRIQCGSRNLEFNFRTAPPHGSQKPFVFAYASDSRSGQGGGERSMYGVNAYIMKKIMAVTHQKGTAFLQFTGDLIDGYLDNIDDTNLQYANWKRSIQPFAHYFPVYATMGNHEALVRIFYNKDKEAEIMIDRFPFENESAEAVFANHFCNFDNGPFSEDGAIYDPDSSMIDFPEYRENVYYYLYGNTAMVVLNSDYLYTPTTQAISKVGGGLHGYIMDVQLEWFERTLKDLEMNRDVEHIFVTQHTPVFPNGGHVGDDMWYRGNNDYRPFIAGRALREGIIQRRDRLLDLAVNQSSKVRAFLTGDEHNYNRLRISPEMQKYPELYFLPKLELKRTIYQINNGAAGAPYYAQEQTPWTPFVSNFTTQNAVVFFHVSGKDIRVEVVNPDTLELVDQFWLTN